VVELAVDGTQDWRAQAVAVRGEADNVSRDQRPAGPTASTNGGAARGLLAATTLNSRDSGTMGGWWRAGAGWRWAAVATGERKRS
jgi:hypothetical protein